MKHTVLILSLTLLFAFGTTAFRPAVAQSWALKTNLLTDALLVPTLGVEHTIGNRNTLSVTATYMPYAVGSSKWKNFTLQPELRWWHNEPLAGFFFGVNILAGAFNIDNVRLGGLYGRQRQGYIVGGGATVGYHRVLSDRWGLELALGVDALYSNYERFKGDDSEGRRSGFIVLPLGTGVTLVYVLK